MADVDLFHHATDSTTFHIFETIGYNIHLTPAKEIPSSLQWLFPFGFTKFMLLELIAAALVILFVVPVVRRLRNGDPAKGKWANAVEGLLLFIRNEVARPAIPDKHEHDHHAHDVPGKPHLDLTQHEVARDNAGGAYAAPGPDLDSGTVTHRADYYLPLLWTLFLFILFCNLLGMLPFSASPTASIMVTGVLSLITFFVIHIAGVKNNGAAPYMKAMIPQVEGLPKLMTVMIQGGVFAIEFMSLFIRNIVLAVRLFANMVGGHTALYLVLLFILMLGKAAGAGDSTANILFWPVTFGSVVLVVLMSVLELFVALLQAYVFTMLTATFIGLAVAPEH